MLGFYCQAANIRPQNRRCQVFEPLFFGFEGIET
jgi:hypothetical protein